MLKKITRLDRIKEMKFSDIDVFKKNERLAREEINFCDNNIKTLKFKLKQLDDQHQDLRSGSDLQNAFQLRMRLDMAVKSEIERRGVLVENHKKAIQKLNKKLAEDNAFGKLIDKKTRLYKEFIEKTQTQQ